MFGAGGNYLERSSGIARVGLRVLKSARNNTKEVARPLLIRQKELRRRRKRARDRYKERMKQQQRHAGGERKSAARSSRARSAQSQQSE